VKCIFVAQPGPFLAFIVSGTSLCMDLEKAKAIVDWLRPTNQKEVQLILRL